MDFPFQTLIKQIFLSGRRKSLHHQVPNQYFHASKQETNLVRRQCTEILINKTLF